MKRVIQQGQSVAWLSGAANSNATQSGDKPSGPVLFVSSISSDGGGRPAFPIPIPPEIGPAAVFADPAKIPVHSGVADNLPSLLAACRAGDESAWTALVAETEPLIRCSVCGAILPRRTSCGDAGAPFIPDTEIIEDIEQAVWERLWRHECRLLRQFDSSRGSWRQWIGQVARCAALDWLRSEARASLPAANRQREREASGHTTVVPLDECPEIPVPAEADGAARAHELLAALAACLTPAERRAYPPAFP